MVLFLVVCSLVASLPRVREGPLAVSRGCMRMHRGRRTGALRLRGGVPGSDEDSTESSTADEAAKDFPPAVKDQVCLPGVETRRLVHRGGGANK